MSEGDVRVAVVIVAYNRRDLLSEAIEAAHRQTIVPSTIVVIDNASDDDSADVARAAGVRVVRLERNTGGAGGFTAGIAVALESSVDWVWLMDDDTIPTPTALAELLHAVAGSETVVAGSRVVWTDGRDHPMNTPRRKPWVSAQERRAAADREVIPVRSSSFVSFLARADVVKERGLPIADYFIWNDDFEYSTRLLRGRRGVFVPSSVVVHKTAKRASTDFDPGPRFYYEVRNKVWMFLYSRSLSPGEKAMYGASSLLRWARTVLRSSDRRVLRDGFRRGMRDGLRRRPRSNADVLEGLPVVDAVVQIERARG